MLRLLGSDREPDRSRLGHLAQVIDVPVSVLAAVEVAADASPQAAAAMGAAHVDVDAGLEVVPTQPADAQDLVVRQIENEGVGSRARREGVEAHSPGR